MEMEVKVQAEPEAKADVGFAWAGWWRGVRAGVSAGGLARKGEHVTIGHPFVAIPGVAPGLS